MQRFTSLSQRSAQQLRKLQNKKYRYQTRSFLLSGDKIVRELLASAWTVLRVLVTSSYLQRYRSLLEAYSSIISVATSDQLAYVSGTASQNSAVAVVKMQPLLPLPNLLKGECILALDGIQDPGNMGAIIRTASWYGINRVVCGLGSVDRYHRGVVQGSMGAFLRVPIHYVDLEQWLQKVDLPIIGATVQEGANGEIEMKKEGILVMGNESHGLSQAVQQLLTGRVHISRLGDGDSLNVGVATGILCDRWRRK